MGVGLAKPIAFAGIGCLVGNVCVSHGFRGLDVPFWLRSDGRPDADGDESPSVSLRVNVRFSSMAPPGGMVVGSCAGGLLATRMISTYTFSS